MQVKLKEVIQALKELDEKIDTINLGENYYLKGVDKYFAEALRLMYELKVLQDQALRFYDAFCDCGSGISPISFDEENETTKCKECVDL
jgi:hypothetical protein